MKKIGILAVGVCMVFAASSYAASIRLNEVRVKFVDASRQVKDALPKSKDVVILTVMFDSCMMAISQIDAYYALLSLLEAMRADERTSRALDPAVTWINDVKRTNSANISSLQSMTQMFDPGTKLYIDRTKNLFDDFNKQLDAELNKIELLRRAAAAR